MQIHEITLESTETPEPPPKSKLHLICDLCGKGFNTKRRVKTHLASHRSVNLRDYTDEYQLVENAKRKIDDRIGFECDECSKIMFSKRGFLRHLRVHSDIRPCVCETCGKAYRIYQDLARHIKDVHEHVKNYKCDICQRAFASKGTRDDHRRIHTGERPYKCEHCPKTFKTLNSIYVHKRVHIDYKPHKCETCGQCFRSKQRLNNHITTHTGVKAFACEICGKSFSVKGEVRRHRAKHNTEKRFGCGGCEFTFAQKRYLRNHIRVQHRERAAELLRNMDAME